MTTINNDGFKVVTIKEKEIIDIVQSPYLSTYEKIKDLKDYGKNFPEIEESVKEAIESIIDTKKAPAKKTPAKKISRDTKVDMTDAERDLLLKAKRQVEEAEELNNDVFQEKLEILDRERADIEYILGDRIVKLEEQNNALQEKLQVLDVDCVKVVIPNHTLKAVVTRQIMKVNEKLSDSVDEVNEVIEKLYADDTQEALRQVSRINDLKNRICDLEDSVNNSNIDDLDYEIETAVQNQLDNYYYVEESDIENMIDDRLEEFATREDINDDLRIYGREINELKARLDNTIYNKVCRLVKSIFSYNLSNKVRSIFKRNKRKKIDLNEIAKQIKESKK